MSPKQSSSLLEQFRVSPQNQVTMESKLSPDPYSQQFSKTDASAMSGLLKNGSLDFGELKSGNSKMSSPFGAESDK